MDEEELNKFFLKCPRLQRGQIERIVRQDLDSKTLNSVSLQDDTSNGYVLYAADKNRFTDFYWYFQNEEFGPLFVIINEIPTPSQNPRLLNHKQYAYSIYTIDSRREAIYEKANGSVLGVKEFSKLHEDIKSGHYCQENFLNP